MIIGEEYWYEPSVFFDQTDFSKSYILVKKNNNIYLKHDSFIIDPSKSEGGSMELSKLQASLMNRTTKLCQEVQTCFSAQQLTNSLHFTAYLDNVD